MKRDYSSKKTCPVNSFAYTVKQGDTLYKLAKTYNTTVEAILAINPDIKDPNKIQIGQIICIPISKVCPPNSFKYTIKSGDTLYKLAQTYNTTVEAILRINPGLDPMNLQIGQIICIPIGPPAPSCPGGFYHTVRRGDTLYKISIEYNVPFSDLMRANPGIDPYNLQEGQKICIPKYPSKPCPRGRIYKVKQGDTFYTIAVRFDVSLNDLIASNPGFNPDRLIVGEEICIPYTRVYRECDIDGIAYLIRPEDCIPGVPVLTAIAEKFVISATDILKLNPDLSPMDFKPGMDICIPKTLAPV